MMIDTLEAHYFWHLDDAHTPSFRSSNDSHDNNYYSTSSSIRILDLYAGSGRLSFELLKKGRVHSVLFVEENRERVMELRKKLSIIEQEFQKSLGEVYQSTVEDFIKKNKNSIQPFHIICMDPPFPCIDSTFEENILAISLDHFLQPSHFPSSFLILRMYKKYSLKSPDLLDRIAIEKIVGDSKYIFLK